ncbi:uncharacterized protein [Amphiura filiformis]|uniref:uncharacterized protein isoform X2 n=1 Tax=Amphiura filiformis TaxID=82378 RepID=UPI003B221770
MDLKGQLFFWIKALMVFMLLAGNSFVIAARRRGPCQEPCGARRLTACQNCLALHGSVRKRTDNNDLLFLLSPGSQLHNSLASDEDWKLPDFESSLHLDNIRDQFYMVMEDSRKRK